MWVPWGGLCRRREQHAVQPLSCSHSHLKPARNQRRPTPVERLVRLDHLPPHQLTQAAAAACSAWPHAHQVSWRLCCSRAGA